MPAGQVWSGSPASYVSDVSSEAADGVVRSAEVTMELSKVHMDEAWKDLALVEQVRGARLGTRKRRRKLMRPPATPLPLPPYCLQSSAPNSPTPLHPRAPPLSSPLAPNPRRWRHILKRACRGCAGARGLQAADSPHARLHREPARGPQVGASTHPRRAPHQVWRPLQHVHPALISMPHSALVCVACAPARSAARTRSKLAGGAFGASSKRPGRTLRLARAIATHLGAGREGRPGLALETRASADCGRWFERPLSIKVSINCIGRGAACVPRFGFIAQDATRLR